MTVRMSLCGFGAEPMRLADLIRAVPGVKVAYVGWEHQRDATWRFYDVEIDEEAVKEAELKEIEKEAEP